MAGKDGNIEIGTKVNTSGIKKGTKEVEKNLKETEKSSKTLGEKFAGLRDVMQGPVAAAKAIVNGVKLAVAAVEDLTTAYKDQKRAEVQLEQSARNNPYLNPSSVARLKAYATELQGITGYGDQELLGFMSQLATAGRTQEQIQKIMKVSLDIAASGTMSLDAAVRNLSKTYGGFAGELGETVPEVRNLTQEQLKNGAAVDILGQRYAGMAEEVAKTTGAGEQLKNSWQALKEELGAPFEKGLAPVQRFFKELIDGWTEAKKRKREYDERGQAIEEGKATSETYAAQIAEARLRIDELTASQEALNKQLKGGVRAERYAAIRQQLASVGAEIKKNEMLIKAYEPRMIALFNEEQAAKRAATNAANDAEAKARENALADYIKDAIEAREQAIATIQLQAKAEGHEADAQEILNAKLSAYVALIMNSNGRVTESSALAQKWIAEINNETQALEENIDAQEKAKKAREELNAALEEIKTADNRPESEKMASQLASLDELYKSVHDNTKDWATLTEDERLRIETEYAEKRVLLEKMVSAAKEAEQRAQVEKALEISVEFLGRFQDIVKSFTEMGAIQIENETALRMAEAEKLYNTGIISQEQFEARKTEIAKEAAQERYRLDMWNWAASIAMATANTALAATKALAEGAIIGPILMAAIIAAGGAQVGALIAAKPVAPAFTTGGIVGGTSYTGDTVVSRLNSAEMILNAGQQRNLFDRINEGNLGGGGINVQVINQASNDVRATPEITEDGVRLMIRRTVAKDMRDGRFNGAYRGMTAGLSGSRLTT